MKKLVVDSINCIGCGACVGIDPKHFDFDDSGLSNVISQDDLNQLQRQLVAANWIQLTTYGTRVTQELWKLTFYAKSLLADKKPKIDSLSPLPLRQNTYPAMLQRSRNSLFFRLP